MCRNQCCEVFVGVMLFVLMVASAASPWYFVLQQLPSLGDDCTGAQLFGWNRLYFITNDDMSAECKFFFDTVSQDHDHVNWRDTCDDFDADCDTLRQTFDGTLSMVLISLLCAFLSMCGSFAHCCTQYSYSSKGTVHKVITWVGFITCCLAVIVFGARMPKSNKELFTPVARVDCRMVSAELGSDVCVPDKFWGTYDWYKPDAIQGSTTKIESVFGPAGWIIGVITALWYLIALCMAHRAEEKQPLAVQQHVTKIYNGYPQQPPQQQQAPQYYAAQPVHVDNALPNNGGGAMYTGHTGYNGV